MENHIDKLTSFFEENGFTVYKTEQDGVLCAELERWTDGGVDMNIFLNPFTKEEYISYVEDFDVDEQIDLHRQDPAYKKAFTISESVEDFNKYHEVITDIKHKLEKFLSE